MPRRIFAKPVNVTLIATLLFIVQNCGQIFAKENEPTPAKPLAELQREVDELLAKKDPVQSRRQEALIFELAERLRSERGDATARPYYEAGLSADSWALEYQLTLGEILARAGQPKVLREKAAMVLRVGEDDAVLTRAAKLFGHKPPPPPPALEAIKADGPTLALVPVGAVNALVLDELCAALHRRLGIKVCVARCEVKVPAATRTMRQRWIDQTRPKILAAANADPALASQLGAWGFTLKQIDSDDAALLQVLRRITLAEQGEEAAKGFDASLEAMSGAEQWDAGTVLMAVKTAADWLVKPGVMVLAVTSLDLCSESANFLFGVGEMGQPFGIISLHRFAASFNGEAPQRTRLIERGSKQALSTFGFMLGIPRCTTPECARAFPQSLAEHDQKPPTPCPQCRAAMEAALKRKLPVEKQQAPAGASRAK